MANTRKTKKVSKPARKPAAKPRAAKPKAPRSASSERRAPSPPSNGNGTTPPLTDSKVQLQHERALVENELATLRAELLEAPEMTGDEVDLNVYEREKTLGLVTAFEHRLEEIDAALRAAAEGNYGKCQRCGTAIDPERLKIFPETRLCVKCKSEAEKEARRLRMQ